MVFQHFLQVHSGSRLLEFFWCTVINERLMFRQMLSIVIRGSTNFKLEMDSFIWTVQHFRAFICSWSHSPAHRPIKRQHEGVRESPVKLGTGLKHLKNSIRKMFAGSQVQFFEHQKCGLRLMYHSLNRKVTFKKHVLIPCFSGWVASSVAMRVVVHQLKGENVMLEVMPHTTIRDLKGQLKALQVCSDELTRLMTQVEIILEDEILVDDDETVSEAGISEDVALQVVFSINPVECTCQEEADCDDESLLVVQIPSSTSEIPSLAFESCKSLVSVQLPDTVTCIGTEAFRDCSALIDVNIPDSVSSIRQAAFMGCCTLKSLMIPDSVIFIGDSAFAKCSSLEHVRIPKELTELRPLAFVDCESLVTVTLPDTLTAIGCVAFSGCSSLLQIHILTRLKMWKVVPLKSASLWQILTFRRAWHEFRVLASEAVNPWQLWWSLKEWQSLRSMPLQIVASWKMWTFLKGLQNLDLGLSSLVILWLQWHSPTVSLPWMEMSLQVVAPYKVWTSPNHSSDFELVPFHAAVLCKKCEFLRMWQLSRPEPFRIALLWLLSSFRARWLVFKWQPLLDANPCRESISQELCSGSRNDLLQVASLWKVFMCPGLGWEQKWSIKTSSQRIEHELECFDVFCILLLAMHFVLAFLTYPEFSPEDCSANWSKGLQKLQLLDTFDSARQLDLYPCGSLFRLLLDQCGSSSKDWCCQYSLWSFHQSGDQRCWTEKKAFRLSGVGPSGRGAKRRSSSWLGFFVLAVPRIQRRIQPSHPRRSWIACACHETQGGLRLSELAELTPFVSQHISR